MTDSSVVIPPTDQPRRKGRGTSVDRMGAMEEKLEKMERAVWEYTAMIERVVGKVEELLADDSIDRMKEVTEEQLDALRTEVRVVQEDLAICKRALANSSTPAASSPMRLDVPKPRTFGGSRNAKEVDNFLWMLEQYFAAANIRDDEAKVRCAPTYLDDTAMLWWRRKCRDIERGICRMETWQDFRTEVKKQFYPENVEYEARGRLRRLTHTRSIKEYVTEFQEIILEIPEITDREALFTFEDGLKGWARQELQRRNVQDLAEAIAAAERLVEMEPRNDPGTSTTREGPSTQPNAERDQVYVSNIRTPKVYGSRPSIRGNQPRECFLCNSTDHVLTNCPQKNRLAAVQYQQGEELDYEQEARLGSILLLEEPENNSVTSGRMRSLPARVEVGTGGSDCSQGTSKESRVGSRWGTSP